ncbi:MAG: hypothetical protein AAF602_07795 [Myxococcota bacterium]
MLVTPGLAVLALVGCDAPPPVFADVLPDERLILREDEMLARGLPDEPAEWATWLLDEARAANRRHTELVLLIEAVSVLPANYRDRGEEDAVVWGPWIVDDNAERIWVEERGDAYGWAIERQTVDPERVRFDDDAWIDLLTGTVTLSASGTPTGGELVLNVDEVGFGAIDAALEAFGDGTGDSASPGEPSGDAALGWAGLRYEQGIDDITFTTVGDLGDARVVPDRGGVTFAPASGGGGTARATLSADRDGDGTPETIEVAVQWDRSGGGRADVTSEQGARSWTEVECWAADHERTFLTGEMGEPADCAF